MPKQKLSKRHRYPSDVTDAQWEMLAPLFEPSSTEPARKYPVRIALNAIFYFNRTGCQWNFLPETFPPWPVVYK